MKSHILFPLTLALSLREREQRSTVWEPLPNAGHIQVLRRSLPLPKGEGWGEGEGGVRSNVYG
jgi:hypothetical protein